MSFAYMPIFTGDYLRDTRHLSPLRHGVYLLALMHCWDSKGPMPLDEQESAGICNCRSSDEIEALRYILGRYFVKMDDGYYNKRMAEEVAKTERLSGAFREAGLKSAEARRAKARGASAKVEPTFNLPSTKVEPRLVSPSPSPSPSVEEKQPSVISQKAPRKRSTPAMAIPDWIDSKAWADYEEMRRSIRKPMTDAARVIAIKTLADLERDGHKNADVLAQSVMNSWQGLFQIKQKGGSYSARRPQQSTAERDAEAMRLLGFSTGPADSDFNTFEG